MHDTPSTSTLPPRRAAYHPGIDELRAPTADDVRAAAQLLEGVAVRTPLERNQRLSDLHGAEIWIKREDRQPVRSYKLRGAYTMIRRLDQGRREMGVVCASAGNHAQGVAHSCRLLDIPSMIFVPTSTPRQKLTRIVELGGSNVHLRQVGDTFDECQTVALEYARANGLVFIPPFDHPDVIAGQGTVGLEILEQLAGRPPDTIVAAVGGGGLLSGIAVAVGEGVRLVGVEPAGAASMTAALAAGGPTTLDSVDTFVDGAAVRRVCALTHGILVAHAVEMVAVDEGRLCTEILALYQHDGIIAEPAGALSLAGLDSIAPSIRGRRVVCVLSGSNNDVSRYAEIAERSLVYEGLKHYFLVEFPQRPGALRGFLDDVLGATDDITFFEYAKKTNRDSGPALVGIELTDPGDLEPLQRRMRSAGLGFTRIDTTSPLFRFLL